MYEYVCLKCKKHAELLKSVHDDQTPVCCERAMDWVPYSTPGKFNYVAGKETGVYEYDYGKKATWDLTVPGKTERLTRDGRISDPFKS